MVKLAHLLVLSGLIIWLTVSGCIGNDTSKEKEAGNNSNYAVAGNSGSPEDLEAGFTQSDLQELDSDMSDLQSLLENSSTGEDIIVENVETEKSENETK